MAFQNLTGAVHKQGKTGIVKDTDILPGSKEFRDAVDVKIDDKYLAYVFPFKSRFRVITAPQAQKNKVTPGGNRSPHKPLSLAAGIHQRMQSMGRPGSVNQGRHRFPASGIEETVTAQGSPGGAQPGTKGAVPPA
jgi:hypothetical protein